MSNPRKLSATAGFRNAPASSAHRAAYIRMLSWAFALFSSVTMMAYLPTMWIIYSHANASQHSLLTWLTWTGANATMAAWLYEENGQRFSRAVAANVGNSMMCFVTSAMIVVFS